MGRNHSNRIVSEIDPKYANEDRQPATYRAPSLKVAAYTCLFADRNEPGDSLKNRTQYYESVVGAQPTWEYVGLYSDEEISATQVCNRKEFNRMVEDCKTGKIDLIVMRNLFCLSRKSNDCLNAMELLLTLAPPVGIYFDENRICIPTADRETVLKTIDMVRELKPKRTKRAHC